MGRRKSSAGPRTGTPIVAAELPEPRPVCREVKRANIWIGTSGWVYKEWAGHFYPKGWPKRNEFAYYAQHFPTVEINATFYRLPTLKMVRGWREKAPPGFLFAVKGSRYLTHIRRLKDTSAGLRKYFKRLAPLADRTGPILWQLPPNFAKNEETLRRLDRFLSRLPTQFRHAVEFRHPSWCDEETAALLRKHRAANVWLSSQRMPADYTLTADFVYLRFHGLAGGAYHDYTADELEPWARALAKAARRGIPSYVFFNNDLNTRAPLNADALMERVGAHAVRAKAATSGAAIGPIKPPRRGPETWRPWRQRRKTAAAAGRRGARETAPTARAHPPAPANRLSRTRPPRRRRAAGASR